MTSTLNIKFRKYNEPNSLLLEKLMGDPKMTKYLGGPEPLEKIKERHKNYLTYDDCYVIEEIETGKSLGWIGNWETSEEGEKAWETGYSILPEYQGKGVATEAIRMILEKLRVEGKFSYVYAYSHVDNKPSNVVCRKSGFTLLREQEGEYPPGNKLRFYVWKYELAK